MLFRAVPFVGEPGRTEENVRRSPGSVTGCGYRGNRNGIGTGRVREGRDQRNIPDESDIGGHRQSVVRRLRLFGVQGAGWSK